MEDRAPLFSVTVTIACIRSKSAGIASSTRNVTRGNSASTSGAKRRSLLNESIVISLSSRATAVVLHAELPVEAGRGLRAVHVVETRKDDLDALDIPGIEPVPSRSASAASIGRCVK